MLETLEHATGPDPRRTVIWLHGLGADGSDFLPVVPELVAPHWPALRFVFPHAPQRPVTLNGGLRMRAWFDLIALDPVAPEDERGIRRSIGEVDALIERELARGVEHIVLAGFSQGGAVALAAGLRQSRPLAAIVALSAWLPLRTSLSPEARAARDCPIWFGHGSRDGIVPLPLGRIGHDLLWQLGYRPTWHEYPIEHTVSLPEIRDLAAWLGRCLVPER